MTAHFLNTVKIMSVKTLVLTSYVAPELLAKLKLIELFVSVHQAYKVTPW